jgi:hypothetical protein
MKSPTAVCSANQAVEVVTITHPFHPLLGRELVLATRRHNWGEDRVMYFNEAGRLCSLPTSWTSAATSDHFALAADGRSWFRVDDLLELSALVQTVVESRKSRRRSVK